MHDRAGGARDGTVTERSEPFMAKRGEEPEVVLKPNRDSFRRGLSPGVGSDSARMQVQPTRRTCRSR